jgi:hypothetical protein
MSGEWEVNDLQCQRCPESYPWRGSQSSTEASARFNDWKVYDGPTMGGGETHVVLCPDCGGSIKRVRQRVYEPIDGQQAFDFD